MLGMYEYAVLLANHFWRRITWKISSRGAGVPFQNQYTDKIIRSSKYPSLVELLSIREVDPAELASIDDGTGSSSATSRVMPLRLPLGIIHTQGAKSHEHMGMRAILSCLNQCFSGEVRKSQNLGE